MSDSTTNLDSLPVGGSGQETRVNDLVDALSPPASFGRRASTSSALNWGFYGTPRYYINATATAAANGTRSITASATRFVSLSRALALTEVATAFDADKLALAKVVSSASALTSWEDHRDPHHLNRFLYGRFVLAMADANKTLTYEQAMCESMELTGTNTALRDVIVPLVPRRWTVFANTVTNGVRVIGASGTGITIAVGKRADVECDGTNVVRLTADV
jgi:hypothetical protein